MPFLSRGIVMVPVLALCFACPRYLGGRNQSKATTPNLDHFYVISQTEQIHPSYWSRHIIDVRSTTDDVTVLDIRIGSLDVFCRTPTTVMAVEATIKNTTPAELVGDLNPCFLPVDAVRRSMEKSRIDKGNLDYLSFSIVARCSGKERIYLLPFRERINFDHLRKENPRVPALYDLISHVQQAAFGEIPTFLNISEGRESELVRLGDSLVPDLLSGKYDMGFYEFCGRKESLKKPYCDSHPTLSLLDRYRPNLKAPRRTARLLDAEKFHFIRYAAPDYPKLAQRARVEAEISLELWFDTSTGKPTKVVVLKGHPLFDETTVDAAFGWQLDVSLQKTGQPIRMTLVYRLNCPPWP